MVVADVTLPFWHLATALLLWLAGYALFGRFIAPRWKVSAKLAFYLVISILLSLTAGHMALLWIIGHPLAGIAGHIAWCRRHGINWLTCRPRDRYLALRPWAARDGFASRNR